MEAWLIPFSAPPKELPKAPLAIVTRHEDRVVLFALRASLGQDLFANLIDLTDVHDRVGFAGDDRNANGTDKPAELVVIDPFDEFADDDPDLPEGWLEEELAASREFWRKPRRMAA